MKIVIFFMATDHLQSCCKLQRTPMLTINARYLLKAHTSIGQVFKMLLVNGITIKQGTCRHNNLLIELKNTKSDV
jgi:hypothetical protein